jgi:hypothetical protein
MAELIAALLAGLGAGVAIAALAWGGSASSARPAARPNFANVSGSARELAPASAGAQPDRPSEFGHQRSRVAIDGELKQGFASSFRRLRESLPGKVELSLVPLSGGAPESLGGDVAAPGWSTMKVPVLAELLLDRGDRGLTAEEQQLARSAITESSNEAIIALFEHLERTHGGLAGASAAVQELFSRSGDQVTRVATAPPPPNAVTTFGQTLWKPSEAVKFFSALARGCLLPADGTAYVLDLMQQIESEESWGLGEADFSPVAFKGGWGPETDGGYVVRQAGIVNVGKPGTVAVSIVAFAPSFPEGTHMLTSVARWLHSELKLTRRPAAGCVS